MSQMHVDRQAMPPAPSTDLVRVSMEFAEEKHVVVLLAEPTVRDQIVELLRSLIAVVADYETYRAAGLHRDYRVNLSRMEINHLLRELWDLGALEESLKE